VAEAFHAEAIPCDLFELKENALPRELNPSVHLVLPLVHGTYGEDGLLSAELSMGGFAYAGCDHAASVLCFDKFACKSIAARVGLPVAPDLHLLPGVTRSYGEIAEAVGATFILKPRRDGSSVGLYLIDGPDKLEVARDDLGQCDYLAETFIDGIDLTVGSLGQEALGVVSVHPRGGIYDYEHKYTEGMSRYEVPADLPGDIAGQLRQWSLDIYRACNCRDLARVDFRMGSEGEIVFLEVNTLPGMTPMSLLPKSAECCGNSFLDVVETWAAFALQRMGGTD
jgi:D-alanine-D-alanine ligase